MSNRTKICIVGASALLAILVLVLCIMGGAFDFSAKTSTGEDLSQSGTQEESITTPEPIATPEPSEPSDVIHTPPPIEDVIPEIEVYRVTVIAGKGGSVSPRGSVEVNEGESVSFTITPDEGYEIRQIKADGLDAEVSDIYTFSDVSSDHSLYVVFGVSSGTGDEDQPEETLPAGNGEGGSEVVLPESDDANSSENSGSTGEQD